MNEQHVGQMADYPPPAGIFLKGPEGSPSLANQSRKYCRTVAAGLPIGGPTRPDVSFNA
jgi:hypothetical protein